MSSVPYGSNRSATAAFLRTVLRSPSSSTMSRNSHRSATAVASGSPRSGMDNADMTWGKYALEAVLINRRAGSSQSSSASRPIHGRRPVHVPIGRSSMAVASYSRRFLPQSHRTRSSARSPLLPVSSSQSWRRHVSSGPWTKRNQSRSSTCPRGQARTKRVGTTAIDSNLPFSKRPSGTRRRDRSRDRSSRLGPLLDDEPFWEPPDADPLPLCAGTVRAHGWREEPWRSHTGDVADGPREPGLVDLLKVGGPRPLSQAPDDDRIAWQIEKGARSPGRDHLTLPDLAVCARAHVSPSTICPLISFITRSTTGSTSRSDRPTLNLAWSRLRKSSSSRSRMNGCAPSTSRLWYWTFAPVRLVCGHDSMPRNRAGRRCAAGQPPCAHRAPVGRR